MSAHRISLGTAQLGLAYGVNNVAGRLTDAEVDAILERAFALGIRALDTAPAYGDAEVRIGRYLDRFGGPSDLRITTKLPAIGDDFSAAKVEHSIAQSRRHLGRVDDVLLHAAADLKHHGHALVNAFPDVRFGVSIYEPDDFVHVDGIEVVQVPFNAFDRRAKAIIEDRRFTVFARSALLQGLLVMDRPPTHLAHAAPWVNQFHAIARDAELSRAALAIRYALRSRARYVVVGVESLAQLEELVENASVPLDDVIAARVDAIVDVPLSVIDPRRWSTP